MTGPMAVTCLSGLLLVASPATAMDPWRVIDAVRRADQSRRWLDSRGHAKLAIRLANGEDLVRRFRFYRQREGGYLVRTLTVFDYPPAVKGTSVLRVHKARGCDQAWIYQPVLRRVRRLPPARLSGRLAGDLDPTELSLAWGLGSWIRAQAEAKLGRRETLAGHLCEVVVIRPHHPVCGYSRLRVWVSTGDWVVRKAELFDTGGSLVKTIEYERIVLVGRYPTAVVITIRPRHGDEFSRLTVEDIAYDTGLDPLLFNVGRLSQAPR